MKLNDQVWNLWWSSGWPELRAHCRGSQVQSLVSELTSHQLLSMASEKGPGIAKLITKCPNNDMGRGGRVLGLL